MNILRQVTLDRSNRRKDKSVSITFITELEQTTKEFMEIDELVGDHGVLYFKHSGKLTQEELDAIEDINIEPGGKSLSQRLRNVLYVLWSKGEANETFPAFYSRVMEGLIMDYKDKIDD